jgi:hypothetical protein
VKEKRRPARVVADAFEAGATAGVGFERAKKSSSRWAFCLYAFVVGATNASGHRESIVAFRLRPDAAEHTRPPDPERIVTPVAGPHVHTPRGCMACVRHGSVRGCPEPPSQPVTVNGGSR